MIFLSRENVDGYEQSSEKVCQQNLANKIEKEAPFDGLGLFEVKWSTLASIISTILTYLVVLVQGIPNST